MSESDVIASTALPHTIASLAADLAQLGVAPGDVLLVHASMSAIGWVAGAAPAAIAALGQALGLAGTLMMPTHSGQLQNPAGWKAPAVPVAWNEIINANMPAFDPATTPTRRMGAIAESFRTHPGVLRSRHPHVSFAARGPAAERLTADHGYDNAMGETSPLARLYELDGRILLLGVGHERNTSMHLAEHRCWWSGKHAIAVTAPVMVEGLRQFLAFQDIRFDDSDFPEIGAAFERQTREVRIGKVGNATARLMRQRPLVDFAASWIAANRGRR